MVSGLANGEKDIGTKTEQKLVLKCFCSGLIMGVAYFIALD